LYKACVLYFVGVVATTGSITYIPVSGTIPTTAILVGVSPHTYHVIQLTIRTGLGGQMTISKKF